MLEQFLDDKSIPDFDLANLVTRLIDDKVISPENGYPDPKAFF